MDSETKRILVVEDDLATLYALRSLFGRRGWEVVLARTVSEALAALGTAFDWIILDLWLPDGDGDGEAVLRRVRASGTPTGVAVTSGALEPERVVRLLELKADLLMTKPIDFARLLDACQRPPAFPGPKGRLGHEFPAPTDLIQALTGEKLTPSSVP